MIFSSFVFLFFFLVITIGLYYIFPRKARNLLLVLSSLVFYAWGEPTYVLVMIFSILFNWISGLVINSISNKDITEKKKKQLKTLVIIICCVANLGALSFFKYTNFVIENINNIGGLAIESLEIVLPIGISFYTFQTLSYVIDVYRGNVEVQKNIIDFATFVTMFPQLIAGPIVKYSDINTQLRGRKETSEMIANGILRFIVGLGKKVLLANKAGAIWDMIYANVNSDMSVALAWLGALAFTFQIYFDFSGYSDMAIGLGQMFGFKFPENFNYPYISKNITEFWRRWHITLSSWFREYVYIPLGGNRKGKSRQIFNLFVVWALTGLWHGASWNFVIWGLYFFVLLMLEKLFLLNLLKKAPKAIGHIYSLFFIIIGWVIFACTPTTNGASGNLLLYFQCMFNGPLINNSFLYLLRTNLLLIVIMCIASTPALKHICKALSNKFKPSECFKFLVKATCCMFVFILSVAYLTGDSYNPFLYFRF